MFLNYSFLFGLLKIFKRRFIYYVHNFCLKLSHATFLQLVNLDVFDSRMRVLYNANIGIWLCNNLCQKNKHWKVI